jgi:CRISPR-associated protein Cas2
LTLVFYDISDSVVRDKVAEACLDSGLKRIQFSVFEGDISPVRRSALAGRLAGLLARSEGEAQVVTYCQADLPAHLKIDRHGAKAKGYVAPSLVLYVQDPAHTDGGHADREGGPSP